MRRLLAAAAAVALSTAVHPVLACEGAGGDQPVVVRPVGGTVLVEASRLESLAAADTAAAMTADRDATRLTTSARELRAEARVDPASRADLLRAAGTLEARAAAFRSRAIELRARGMELRARAAELRASVDGSVTLRVATRTQKPPMRHHRMMGDF